MLACLRGWDDSSLAAAIPPDSPLGVASLFGCTGNLARSTRLALALAYGKSVWTGVGDCTDLEWK